MAKSKRNKNKKEKLKKEVSEVTQPNHRSKKESAFYLKPKWHMFSLFVLGFLLYANTLGHDYTQDDAIVIYDNMFTQEGVSGIPGILSNDTFYGFFKEAGKAKLVSGGRYRPFTQVMFALEWQLFGRNPMIGHLINVLLYALLVVLIYKTLTLLIVGAGNQGARGSKLMLFIFGVCLIYLVHPIHTEAVANIKGRDEIMSMFGGIASLWCVLKYEVEQKRKWQLLAAVSFFIGLMSKENAITFLAIIPIGLMLFRRKNFLNSFKAIWPLLLSTLIFLGIRTAVLGLDFGGASMELMNNPFIKAEGTRWVPFTFAERMATILFTLGKYLQLMVFPHPLCHDYYPRAIEIMSFGDWQVLLTLALYIGLAFGFFYFWKRERIVSFGILFFAATLSIVSNVVFPIGTNMSERFMFMPSLGVILVLGHFLFKYIKSEKVFLAVVVLLSLILGGKTILRNQVWKDDFTLFTTDVKTNYKSAKLLNAAGGAMSTTASDMPPGEEKNKMLESSIGYLKQAIEIHPTYKNAYLLLGNSSYYLNRFDEAISYFDQALRLDPNFKDAQKNLPIVLRDAGRYYGEIKQDLDRSKKYLDRSYELSPNDPETNRLLGIVYGMKGDNQKAISYFQKVTQVQPGSAPAFVNLGTAYRNSGDMEKAQEAFSRAVQLDPNALNKLQK